jgi:hypothetical protein
MINTPTYPKNGTDAEKWVEIKTERTRRIDAIRWMLDDGVPISFAKRQEILNYIQALRDVPQTFSDNPDLVTFPEAPSYG